MRVIAGKAGGRRLETLSGRDVRPTTDMVKEAAFSIIQFDIEGRCFLDLFAGSGQMGIEALSRGAKRAVLVDSSRSSLAVIKRNLEAAGLSDAAEVAAADSIAFLGSCRDSFDIAYLDPPYRTGLLRRALDILPPLMNKGGRIICEHPRDEELPEEIGGFGVKKHYRYGKIMLTVYVDRDHS